MIIFSNIILLLIIWLDKHCLLSIPKENMYVHNIRFKMYIPLVLIIKRIIIILPWHSFLIPTILCILTCIRTCCSNCVYLFPLAPPSYAEVVTEEQRRNNLAPVSACDDFERALQGPLFAYIQEFRFLPPPLYSEVSTSSSTVKWAGFLGKEHCRLFKKYSWVWLTW